MGWPVSDVWMAALASPHSLDWLVTTTRGGRVLAADLQVDQLSMTASWDGYQITREVRADITDPDGTLLTADPESPLAPWGQQLVVRARLSTGAAWSHTIPVGTFRVEDAGPDGAATMILLRDGTWVTGGQTLHPTGRDMLQQLADERWTNWVQPHVQDVRRAWQRVVLGVDLHLGRWTAPTPVPADMEWGSTKLDAAIELAKLDGRTMWCDRAGLLQLVSSTAGTGDTWTYRVGGDVAVSVTVQASRTGAVNGAAVHAESTEEGRPEIWGAAYAQSGPLAWGGPFGRIPDVQTSKLVKTAADATTAAQRALTSLVGARMATVTVTAPANPAVDVLDTATITLPRGRSMSGLITRTDMDAAHMTLTVQIPWEQVWHDR